MTRKILVAILVMVLFSACGNSEKGKKETDKEKQNAVVTDSLSDKKDALVKELTYKGFINEVWDFERFPDSFAYKGKLPCVIDFYATWCGPCKKVAPLMEKLAQDYKGKIVVYKVNTETEQKLASILKIRNIPTVFFLEKDKQPSYSVGAKDEIYFRSKFDKLVK